MEIDSKTLKQDLQMLTVALECYMGKDLEEDSNLSRPVKRALSNFEKVINNLEEDEDLIKNICIANEQLVKEKICAERALDKACERLSETYPKYDFSDKECLVRKILVPKEEWKEYLLKQAKEEFENSK